MNEDQAIKKLISTASAEIGYMEKASNKNLDDKTANAGKGNYTKYARDLVKLIGSPYAQGAAWCDMFVDWCFVQTFGKDNAKKMLGGWSAYTPTSADLYKKAKRFYQSPAVGDQIFFKNSERINHTGIVVNVTEAFVYTIEGNSSNKVQNRSYSLKDKSIAGYGKPNWSVVATKEEPTISQWPKAMVENIDISDILDPNVFDVRRYRAAYKDLDSVFGNNWQMYYYHYKVIGKTEIETKQRPPFM
jgi:hypothetical protein